jgi:UDP-N-acetyl-D-glucosamine dehydrogenase
MADRSDEANTMAVVAEPIAALFSRLSERSARICVIGLGYVGLPLSVAAWQAGWRVIGYDVDPSKVAQLMRGESPVGTVQDALIEQMRASDRFVPSSEESILAAADVLIICVPTPLDKHRNPDLSYVVHTAEAIARHARHGQLVVLESTTYPGTTSEVVKPILERAGHAVPSSILLAYSPEREDPGNTRFETSTIPRVLGADDSISRRAASIVYEAIVAKVHHVSSTRTAEAVKITENVFRSVNIALVNELKLIYAKMGIDIWEVIDAAKTKPFGFMPFYPGPGLGGHCIPIDPFYLTWKAREFEFSTKFIELAGEVNADAPRQVVSALVQALSEHRKASLNGASVLLVGLAYKKNVDDMRESPSLVIWELLEHLGATVSYHDPYIPVVPPTRNHPQYAGRRSETWSSEQLRKFDVVLICTDHDNIDFKVLVDTGTLTIDTRNATRDCRQGATNVVLA